MVSPSPAAARPGWGGWPPAPLVVLPLPQRGVMEWWGVEFWAELWVEPWERHGRGDGGPYCLLQLAGCWSSVWSPASSPKEPRLQPKSPLICRSPEGASIGPLNSLSPWVALPVPLPRRPKALPQRHPVRVGLIPHWTLKPARVGSLSPRHPLYWIFPYSYPRHPPYALVPSSNPIFPYPPEYTALHQAHTRI